MYAVIQWLTLMTLAYGIERLSFRTVFNRLFGFYMASPLVGTRDRINPFPMNRTSTLNLRSETSFLVGVDTIVSPSPDLPAVIACKGFCEMGATYLSYALH